MQEFLNRGSLLLAGLSLFACNAPQSEGLEPRELVFEEEKVPAGEGSRYGNLLADGEELYLSWLDASRETSVLLAARKADGNWTEVDTLASGADVLLNFADFPSVSRTPEGELAVHYLQTSSEELFAYDVKLRSGQFGAWSPAQSPHRDSTITEHGFVSMFPLEKGMGIAWLDGRNYAGAEDPHAHGGPMTLRFSRMQKGSIGPSELLDARVCDCCQTDAARTKNGALLVYRNRTEEEIRDIGLLRYENGKWSAPRMLSEDGWEVHGCPVNGPAIAAADTLAAMAWFTSPDGKASIKLRFSQDEGAHWSDPLLVDSTAALGRVDVALLPDATALLSWVDGEENPALLKVARYSPEGRKISEQVVARMNSRRSSGFPRMAVTDRAVWLTYTHESKEGKELKLLKASL